MKISWVKGGLIFKPHGMFPWSRTHAQVPFPLKLENDKVRVFFSTRDEKSRSAVSFVDLDINDPSRVLYVHDKPCMQYGAPGTFDDAGVMPSWFMKIGETIRMYYTGWNRSDTASYRLAIGLAESYDNGLTFKRLFEGPVMDRDRFDPIWVGQPCVMLDGDKWRMWYLSCERIEIIDDRPEPFYNIKYAESHDGLLWTRRNIVCIDFDDKTDAIGRPCVWKQGNRYYMLHSNRMARDYRTDAKAAYRIELSVSDDGIHWLNMSKDFDFKKGDESWENIMNEYCAVYWHGEKLYMLYNGNGFGASGFGFAIVDIRS